MAKDNVSNLLIAFTLGGLVGAGLALLFAPQSGEKTRRKIKDAYEDAKDGISDYADRIKSRVS